MKKRFLFLCCLCLAVVLVGCQKNDPPRVDDGYDKVRKAAWDLLVAEELVETVTHSWEDAKVKVGEFLVLTIPDFLFERHYCYHVVFLTTEDAILGPMGVFLDISSLERIGVRLRY